jgi:hypothetical protein
MTSLLYFAAGWNEDTMLTQFLMACRLQAIV